MTPHLFFDWHLLIRVLPDLASAAVLTLEIFVLSLFASFLGGVVLAVARLAHGPVRAVATVYVEFYRNTPLLTQLYFIFFGLPAVGIALPPFASGVLALTAQHAAFFAEILRGAIQSVDVGQRDAGQALGMTSSKVMSYVIFPPAIRDAIPAIGNQLVLLVQDTSLVSTIGIIELTLKGYMLAESTAASFEMFVGVGAIYLVFTSVMFVVTRRLEQRYRVVR